MIQASELRIGDYILIDGAITQVNLKLFSMMCEYGDNFSLYFDIDPIPLTEDVLLKCGFSGYAGGDNCKKFSLTEGIYIIQIVMDNETLDFELYLDDGEEVVYLGYVYQLHRLQNLFFALTNQELEVKL